MNRNRGKKKPDGSPLSSRDLTIQKQDWEKIKNDLRLLVYNAPLIDPNHQER
jgi:hypothetical protein